MRREKKKRPILKIIIGCLLTLALAYIALFLIVIPEKPDHPFFDLGGKPLVIAHRGGAALAPENTLLAFELALELGVDILELDVQLSKDKQVVVIHDETVDRTTDGEGRVADLALDELKELDAAYTFRDRRGNFVFRNQGITIPTLEEVFEAFPQARLLVDLKYFPPNEDEASVSPEEHAQVKELLAKKVWELIEAYERHDLVLVSSLDDELLAYFQNHAQGQVPIVSGEQEATRFAFYHKIFLGRIYRPEADVISLPSTYKLVDLVDQRLIDGAQRRNMPIFYWDINEEELMRDVIEKGVDGVITDRPDLLIRVKHEMEDTDED